MKHKLVLLSALALTLGACTQKKEEAKVDEIKVGLFAALTGEIANFGQSTSKGVELAKNEFNAAGGLNGKKINVITYDDQGKPEEAVSTVTKLISQDNVLAVLGEVASSLSNYAADVAMRNKTPMLSSASTNPNVTQKGEYIFRICFIDPFQGEVMAKFSKDTLKAKSAGILRDIKQDYSVGLADFYTKAFVAGGGKIVIDTSYQSKDVDYKAQLTEIKNKKPDVVFVPGYYNDVALIIRQARAMGITQPILGGDGWESDDLNKIAGKSLENTFYSNHYAPDTTDAGAQNFIKNFTEKFGARPDAMAALGYDSFFVMMDAMKRAKSLTREDIKVALAQTKEFPGVTGKITIDKNRNAVKSAVVLKYADGKWKYHATVNP